MRRTRAPDALWSQLGGVRVVYETPCVHPDGEHVDGWCEYGARVLHVDSAQSLENQIQTAFHEAGHLWLRDANITLRKKQEEDVVTCFANALVNCVYGRPPRVKG